MAAKRRMPLYDFSDHQLITKKKTNLLYMCHMYIYAVYSVHAFRRSTFSPCPLHLLFYQCFFLLFFTIKCDFLVVLALNRTEYDYKDIQCERRSSPFMFKSAINHIRISRCRQHLPTYISMYKRSVHYKWCK